MFNLTLVNDTTKTNVLSSIGFEAHAVGCELKGLSHNQKIAVVDGYVLHVEPIAIGIPQMLQLPDPIPVPASHPVRVRLPLAGLRRNLRGNESLVHLLVAADGVVQRSRLINLGGLSLPRGPSVYPLEQPM
ncbi:MAG: hypothetical protein ACRETC_08840 [Gammaproteobacteria bacterium]